MFSLGLFESESSLNLTAVPIPSVPKGEPAIPETISLLFQK